MVPSASLISQDATVLFTIAGMAPFKPYFLGQRTPPFPRATSVQKCVRTGDIENVGLTTRHNTFFQMAGNFSFGDYFKEGAIEHAWALLTGSLDDGGFGLDPERLWVTVYETDDEAAAALAGGRRRARRSASSAAAWPTTSGRWACPDRAGPARRSTTTAGPSSAIEGGPVADEDRYLEVWNLVFMQDMRGDSTAPGKGDFPILGPLPQQNIDTGLGVERLAFLLQGVDNVYETDLLRPIIGRMEELSGPTVRREPRQTTCGCG